MDALIVLSKKLPRREGATPNAPGPTIEVRILRECGRWRAGQTGSINADYGRELVRNGLAEEIKATAPKRAVPTR